MAILKNRWAQTVIAASAAALSVVTLAPSANAAPVNDGVYCYFYRGSDQVVTVGPVHAGIATGDCSFVTFGRGFPGADGHTGTIGVLNVPLPGGEWFVIELEDSMGLAPASSDGRFNMPI